MSANGATKATLFRVIKDKDAEIVKLKAENERLKGIVDRLNAHADGVEPDYWHDNRRVLDLQSSTSAGKGAVAEQAVTVHQSDGPGRERQAQGGSNPPGPITEAEAGDEATKTTCLWLKALPPLKPTKIVGKGERHVTKSGKSLPKWYNLPPSEDRARIRSRTFPGLARAMAEQWGQP